MPIGSGTSLICVAAEDDVYLVADDLVTVTKDGQEVPHARDFRKLGAAGNILIGSAGLLFMVHNGFKYLVTDWLHELIAEFEGKSDALPSSVAERICQKLRETFKAAEPLVTQGVWRRYVPGDRLINFVIAGYTKNFKRPYVFEVGVEINQSNDGLLYRSPIPHQKPLPHHIRFGEDYFMERADAGFVPEQSALTEIIDQVFPEVVRTFPHLSPSLQENLACSVGCLKLEAHFNPQQIGSRVFVSLVDRKNRATYPAAF